MGHSFDRAMVVDVMHLVGVEFAISTDPVPADVARLIADAQARVEEFSDRQAAIIPAFVPSDFELVYRALVAIDSARLAAGRRFIEWGSGLGVITCLAERVGFDAVGIEIEPELVDIAEALAAEHGIDTKFALGSFVPPGAEPHLEMPDDVAWLSTTGPDGYDELQVEPDEFDVVFANPWPGEEQVIFDLFLDCASVGALLLTYHGQEGLRLQRKVR
jgi:predicted O-methyltransferase YrrM